MGNTTQPSTKQINNFDDEKIDDQISNDQQLIENAKKNGTLKDTDGWGYQYQHNVTSQEIDCPSMIKLKTKNPLHCNVYYSMKEHCEYNQQNIDHIINYHHFEKEIEHKPVCKYGQECKSYKRSEKGIDENKISDKCHMIIYRHPPRTRQIKLSQNIHSLIMNKSDKDNHPLYVGIDKDAQQYGIEAYSGKNKNNPKDGWLQALIDEVISNGYKYDLCLKCGQNDKCKHDVNKSSFTILRIVDEKMDCNRHIIMGRPLTRDLMLALILYTGCDCNYDLCSSQRNGDYNKWKWFDNCLYHAIQFLSLGERGLFDVYSGLNGVQLGQKKVDWGYFVTYISTSCRKSVAQSFMGGDKGMIIQIDKGYKDNVMDVMCCDVSWISKFPDEAEILFARSLASSCNDFECSILDESNGIQTISLKKA